MIYSHCIQKIILSGDGSTAYKNISKYVFKYFDDIIVIEVVYFIYRHLNNSRLNSFMLKILHLKMSFCL